MDSTELLPYLYKPIQLTGDLKHLVILDANLLTKDQLHLLLHNPPKFLG